MKFDINTLKEKIMFKYPPFSKFLLKIEFVETTDIKIAETDGKRIYYNPIYFKTITEEEQIFVFSHEICHIALNHIERMKGKNPKIWNYATDGIINEFLKKNGPVLKNAILIPNALEYSAEELYEKLLDEYKDKDESSIPKPHTSHDHWEKLIKKENFNQENNKETTEKFDNEKELFQKINSSKKEQLQKVKEELLREESFLFEAANKRNIEKVGTSSSLIEWKHFLKDATNKDMDWSYIDSYIEYGVINPTLKEISFPETEVILDTSGSIKEDTLRSFLKECKNILKYTKLKVGCFDKKFYGFHEIKSFLDLENMPLEGGGGTDFNVAINAFTRRVENKIIFTDGKAIMPSKRINVLWIVLGDEIIKPNGGKAIYIKEKQLQKIKTK